jgi:hypothetical protein
MIASAITIRSGAECKAFLKRGVWPAHEQRPISGIDTSRVAVIVPAYGVAHLVREALASLQRQTLADWGMRGHR